MILSFLISDCYSSIACDFLRQCRPEVSLWRAQYPQRSEYVLFMPFGIRNKSVTF